MSYRDPLPGYMLWKDTSGHWIRILRDLRSGVALLAAAGRGNIDGEPIGVHWPDSWPGRWTFCVPADGHYAIGNNKDNAGASAWRRIGRRQAIRIVAYYD